MRTTSQWTSYCGSTFLVERSRVQQPWQYWLILPCLFKTTLQDSKFFPRNPGSLAAGYILGRHSPVRHVHVASIYRDVVFLPQPRSPYGLEAYWTIVQDPSNSPERWRVAWPRCMHFGLDSRHSLPWSTIWEKNTEETLLAFTQWSEALISLSQT